MDIDPAIPTQPGKRSDSAVTEPSKQLAVLALIGLSAVFLVSLLLNPSTGDYFTVCGFKNFTGLPCPGCGLTHSFCALGKGDMIGAFGFNLLGPPVFLIFVLAWIRSACVLMNKSGVQLFGRLAQRFNIVRIFAIAFLVYGVIRIIYILAYRPLSFRDSPLSQLIARIIH